MPAAEPRNRNGSVPKKGMVPKTVRMTTEERSERADAR